METFSLGFVKLLVVGYSGGVLTMHLHSHCFTITQVFLAPYFLITTIVFPCFAWCYNYIHYIHYIHIGVLFMLQVVSRLKLKVHSLCGSVYGLHCHTVNFQFESRHDPQSECN